MLIVALFLEKLFLSSVLLVSDHLPPFLTIVHIRKCAHGIYLEIRNNRYLYYMWASQVALVGKNPPASAGHVIPGFDPWVRKIP